MIAYNHKSLDNLLISEEVQQALSRQLISKEEADAIEKAYPVDLYSPNLFIRIGLLLLTTLVAMMAYGFFCIAILSSSEKAFGTLTLVSSLVTYAALEFFARQKKYYRSGIDDALTWLSMTFFVAAINLLSEDTLSLFYQSMLIGLLACWFLYRFGNVLAGGVAFVSFLLVVFAGLTPLGTIAKSIMPFLIMAICFVVYWLAHQYKHINVLRHYKACFTLIEILALLLLYAAGNYYVVREVSDSMFELDLKPGQSIPGAWFFWTATILIPLVYIFRGIQKRSAILLRTGLVLIAAIVFTIRYYHHVAPLEIAMTIGGIIMILVAYGVTKYLTPAKHGFTHAEPNDPQVTGLLQLESLIVAQTYPQTPVAGQDQHFDFGGGSSGGAGSSGGWE